MKIVNKDRVPKALLALEHEPELAQSPLGPESYAKYRHRGRATYWKPIAVGRFALPQRGTLYGREGHVVSQVALVLEMTDGPLAWGGPSAAVREVLEAAGAITPGQDVVVVTEHLTRFRPSAPYRAVDAEWDAEWARRSAERRAQAEADEALGARVQAALGGAAGIVVERNRQGAPIVVLPLGAAHELLRRLGGAPEGGE